MIPRTDLDVNVLSSSQMMCGVCFAAAKIQFFSHMQQNRNLFSFSHKSNAFFCLFDTISLHFTKIP